MKKITLILSLLLAISTASFAQCDKTIVLSSSKTDHMDAAGAIIRTEDETAQVEIDKSAVNVSINGDHKITANIKSNTCNWTVPFKEGKSVIKAVADRNGEDQNFTITIEGKDGKVTLLFERDDHPDDRIKVAADKFAEKI